MLVEQINTIQIRSIKVKEPKFLYNEDLPPFWFQVIGLIGGRGFGKTTLSCNILQLQKPYIDKLYVVSPNISTDKKVMEVVKKFDYILKEDLTPEILKEIYDDIDRRIELYQTGERLYKLIKRIKKEKIDVLDKDDEMFIDSLDEDTADEAIRLLKKGRPPTSVLWLSDMVGNKLFHKHDGDLVKGIIKNRHRYMSVLMETQNLKSIAPPVRKCISIFLIAPTLDRNYMKQIYEEVQGAIPTFDDFIKVMEEVGSKPYQFLMIFNNGVNRDVRINFDRRIVF
jgi:hypothetical protein